MRRQHSPTPATRPRFRRPRLLGGITACALTCQLVAYAWGITWCHDYTLYRASNRTKNVNRTGIEDLRNWLTKEGYRAFSFTTAAHDPQAGTKLKPGDVIVFRSGNGHSAFVNEQGLVDHFIQTAGATGTAYEPAVVEQQKNFRRGDTLYNIVNTKHALKTYHPDGTASEHPVEPYKNSPVEIWRKPPTRPN